MEPFSKFVCQTNESYLNSMKQMGKFGPMKERLKMKRNLLIFGATLTGVFFLSGCYTKFAEPIVRQEIYEQAESDTVILDDQSFENYSFDTSNLNDYNTGYRDAYQDFLRTNLWYGYSANPRMYFSYRYGYYPNNSYFLGYYDPWSYDPFYDWDYYRYYSYYGGYYSGYYNPYYGWYGGGYRGHYNHWYYYSGGSGETVAKGPDQIKAQWHAKETPVSGSRASSNANSSDFQNTISYMPSSFQASSTTSASNTKTATTITGSSSQKAHSTSKNPADKTTTGESIVGFQTTLTPATAPHTTIIRKNTGSPTSSKATYTNKSGSSHATTSKRSTSNSKSSSSNSSSSNPSSSSSSSNSSSGSSNSSSSSTSSSSSSNSNSSSSNSGSSSSSSPSSSPKAHSSSSKSNHK